VGKYSAVWETNVSRFCSLVLFMLQLIAGGKSDTHVADCSIVPRHGIQFAAARWWRERSAKSG
jgi:hypothetical protein